MIRINDTKGRNKMMSYEKFSEILSITMKLNWLCKEQVITYARVAS